MIDFAPGMRTIIRDEEWMVKKIETNSLGNKTLYCVGISPLVKDREAIFLTDLEEIQIVDPAEVKLVADTSPFYKRALLYLESQWRQQIPTIYTSCCNTTKGIYYYTTYDNHQITAVDMYAENLDSDKLIRYPIILNGEIRWHNK